MKSPFSKDRFEHTASHVYYLPESIITNLEDTKPSYVIGSRGSGKTTLLKSLHWEERVKNDFLVEALGGDMFRGNFVAAYVKLPNVMVRALRKWLKTADDDNHAAIFGLYIDLIAVELLADAVGNLVSDGYLILTPDREEKVVGGFFDLYSTIFGVQNRPLTFFDFRSAIRKHRRLLEHQARISSSVDLFLEESFVPEVGELSREFSKHLAEMRVKDGCNDVPLHFKVCMDEAECLDLRQQQVVNTLIRICEFPISYIVSYVGTPLDSTTTVHEALSQQRADRHVVDLDLLKRQDFESLCNGVASSRVNAELGDKAEEFSTEKVLGRLDLNFLVEVIVAKSESEQALTMRRDAEAFLKSNWGIDRLGEAKLPYIESYVAKRLGLSLPDFAKEGAKRKQESAEFRKKIVAAYLSICHDLNVKKIPYAFDRMVFGISDRCVRDYLSQMHHIFVAAKMPLESFILGQIPVSVQESAIREASEEKRDSIPESGVLKPIQIGRFVRGLAELTALLQQGRKEDAEHLRSSERGLFEVNPLLGSCADDLELCNLVLDAADSGFLRLTKEGKAISSFRVHSSLAPVYGFSYRGSYYPVTLERAFLRELVECATNESLSAAVLRVFSRHTQVRRKSDTQLLLFPDIDTKQEKEIDDYTDF